MAIQTQGNINNQGGINKQESINAYDYVEQKDGLLSGIAGNVKDTLKKAAEAQTPPPSPAPAANPSQTPAVNPSWRNAKNTDELAAFPEYAAAVRNAQDGVAGLEDQEILAKYEELHDKDTQEPAFVTNPRKKRLADEVSLSETGPSEAAPVDIAPMPTEAAPVEVASVETAPVETASESMEKRGPVPENLELVSTVEDLKKLAAKNTQASPYNVARGPFEAKPGAPAPQTEEQALDRAIELIRWYDARIEIAVNEILSKAKKKALTDELDSIGLLKEQIDKRREATYRVQQIRESLEAQGKEVFVPKEVGTALWEDGFREVERILLDSQYPGSAQEAPIPEDLVETNAPTEEQALFSHDPVKEYALYFEPDAVDEVDDGNLDSEGVEGELVEEAEEEEVDESGENLEEEDAFDLGEMELDEEGVNQEKDNNGNDEPDVFRTYGLERRRRIEHELKLHDKYKKFWNPRNLWKAFDGFVKDEEENTLKPGEELTECIVRFCDIFQVEVTDKSDVIFFSMMCKFLGVNPDRHNLLFGKKQDGKNQRKIPVGTLSMALDIMERNVREGKHFFAYRHDGLKLYDTACFPVPIFSFEEVEFMTAKGAIYEGVPASEIIDAANIEWKRNVYPRIKEEGDIALKKSYETFVRFLNDYTSYLHGGTLTSGHWGVPDVYHAFPSEIVQEFPLSELGELNPDVKESAEMVKEAIVREMVHQTVYKAQKGGRYRSSVARDFRELGYTEQDISATESQLAATNIIEGTAKACSALSLFPDVFLAGSSAAEAVIGNAETKGILYFRHLAFSEEEKLDFVMSHKLRELCHTDEVYEMISTIKVIDSSFGRAATIRYLSEENIYTPETATAWVNKHFGSKSARKKAKGGLEESKWLARMNKFYDAMQNIQTGEWIARRYDAELFIDSFLVNQRNKKKRLGEGGVYITSEDLLNSFKMDSKKTIRDLLLTKEGLQAYAWSQMRTLGGNSLVAARYERFANEHRIAGSAIRFFIANFPMFMLNATSRLNPLLHTSQLISLKTRSRLNGRELNQQDFFEILATDDFLQALKLDMLRAPGCVARIAICCAIYALIPGDFDEPEDENKKGMWDEWVFGVQYDEDGNRIIGSGFRARQMWYMYDILGWAGPSSVAIYAFFTGKASLSEACAILTDGMSDIVFDLAPGEFVNILHDFDTTWQQAQALALSDGLSDPESLTPPETAIDFLGSVFSVSSLDFITRKFTPRVVREFWTAGWGPDFIAPDPTKIFTVDPNDGDKTEYVDDWTERNLRIKASKNPVMGILLNIASGYYWNDDPTKQMTGYAPWDMPDMEKADPTNVAFYSHFYGITGEYNNGVFTGSDESVAGIEECFRIIDGVSAKVPSNQVGLYLAQNGLCLPPGAQYAMVGYCWGQMSELRDQYYSGRITYDIYSEHYDYYQSKVNLLNSGVIPTSPKKYKQWRTDYQAYYKDSEGEYHSELAYQLRNAPVLRNIFDLMGVDDLEVEFSPYGNYDTPAQLIQTMVHSAESSYDAQTLAAWQGDFTDPAFVKMMCEDLDLVIEYGRDSGKNVWEVITGDEQAFQADGSIKFVIGSRAYTPVDEPIEYKEEDDGGDGGGSGGTSSGRSGRSYGGYTYVGAGSYKPKIYSNPRSVNNDRAATMYAKTPYTANRTYLRPAFFTKGSREAYRRQDM